jgi:hypothetical protein
VIVEGKLGFIATASIEAIRAVHGLIAAPAHRGLELPPRVVLAR